MAKGTNLGYLVINIIARNLLGQGIRKAKAQLTAFRSQVGRIAPGVAAPMQRAGTQIQRSTARATTGAMNQIGRLPAATSSAAASMTNSMSMAQSNMIRSSKLTAKGSTFHFSHMGSQIEESVGGGIENATSRGRVAVKKSTNKMDKRLGAFAKNQTNRMNAFSYQIQHYLSFTLGVTIVAGTAMAMKQMTEMAIDFQKAVINATCYDEKTEVLTKNGWKKWPDVTGDEEFATINPETRKMEYAKASLYMKQHYKGKMYRLKTGRIDLKTTPNHKMLVKRRHSDKWELIEAEDIFGDMVEHNKYAEWEGEEPEYFTLPEVSYKKNYYRRNIISRYDNGHIKAAIPSEKITKIHRIEERKIPIEDWLEFFGYWIAEGCVSKVESNGEYIITFTNLDENIREDIFKSIEKIKQGKTNIKRHNRKNISFNDKQIYEYLNQFGHSYEKYLPQYLKELSPRLLKIFFNAYMAGDGSKRGRACFTSSKQLRDDLEEIILKIGWNATHSQREKPPNYINGRKIEQKHDAWVIYINRKELTPLHNPYSETKEKQEKWVDYDGMIYSVEVPYHTLFVRRNGKSIWSGNTVSGHLEETFGKVTSHLREMAMETGATTIFTAKEASDALYTFACLPPDEIVLDGNYQSQPIKDIEVGDEVIGKDGQPVRVNKVFSRPCTEGRIIDINPAYVNSFRVTPNHPLLVIRPHDKNPQWVDAGDLTLEDYLLLPSYYAKEYKKELFYNTPTDSIATEDYIAIPIRDLSEEEYYGDVINVETEDGTFMTSVITHNSAGFDVANMTANQLRPVLDYAAATQADLGDATETVIPALRNFKLSAKHTGRVVDAFVGTIINTLTTADRLQKGLQYVGAEAGSLGLTVEETVASLGALYNRGIQAGRAGRMMRMMMLRLLKPTDKAREHLNKLGLTIEDINPETHNWVEILQKLREAGWDASTAAEVLGTRSAAAGIALVESAEEISVLEGKLHDVGGLAHEVASKQITSLWGVLKLLKSAFQAVELEIFKRFQPALQSIIKVGRKLVKMGPKLIKPFADFAKALYNLLTATPWMRDVMKSLAGAISLTTVAMVGLLASTKLIAPLIGMLMGGVTGLAGAFMTLTFSASAILGLFLILTDGFKEMTGLTKIFTVAILALVSGLYIAKTATYLFEAAFAKLTVGVAASTGVLAKFQMTLAGLMVQYGTFIKTTLALLPTLIALGVTLATWNDLTKEGKTGMIAITVATAGLTVALYALKAGIESVKTSIISLFAALGPIGWAIAAIGALISALAALGWLQDAADAIGGAIHDLGVSLGWVKSEAEKNAEKIGSITDNMGEYRDSLEKAHLAQQIIIKGYEDSSEEITELNKKLDEEEEKVDSVADAYVVLDNMMTEMGDLRSAMISQIKNYSKRTKNYVELNDKLRKKEEELRDLRRQRTQSILDMRDTMDEYAASLTGASDASSDSIEMQQKMLSAADEISDIQRKVIKTEESRAAASEKLTRIIKNMSTHEENLVEVTKELNKQEYMASEGVGTLLSLFASLNSIKEDANKIDDIRAGILKDMAENTKKLYDIKLKLYKLRQLEYNQATDLFNALAKEGKITEDNINAYSKFWDEKQDVTALSDKFNRILDEMSESKSDEVTDWLATVRTEVANGTKLSKAFKIANDELTGTLTSLVGTDTAQFFRKYAREATQMDSATQSLIDSLLKTGTAYMAAGTLGGEATGLVIELQQSTEDERIQEEKLSKTLNEQIPILERLGETYITSALNQQVQNEETESSINLWDILHRTLKEAGPAYDFILDRWESITNTVKNSEGEIENWGKLEDKFEGDWTTDLKSIYSELDTSHEKMISFTEGQQSMINRMLEGVSASSDFGQSLTSMTFAEEENVLAGTRIADTLKKFGWTAEDTAGGVRILWGEIDTLYEKQWLAKQMAAKMEASMIGIELQPLINTFQEAFGEEGYITEAIENMGTTFAETLVDMERKLKGSEIFKKRKAGGKRGPIEQGVSRARHGWQTGGVLAPLAAFGGFFSGVAPGISGYGKVPISRETAISDLSSLTPYPVVPPEDKTWDTVTSSWIKDQYRKYIGLPENREFGFAEGAIVEQPVWGLAERGPEIIAPVADFWERVGTPPNLGTIEATKQEDINIYGDINIESVADVDEFMEELRRRSFSIAR